MRAVVVAVLLSILISSSAAGQETRGNISGATAISATATTREIVVVLNWFDEVRRKVR